MMMKSMTLLGALAISCSAFGATQEADVMALILVSQFSQKCPAEFATATSGKAILSVTSESSESADYASTTVMITGYPAASINASKTAVHRVTLQSKVSDEPGPSGMRRFAYNCKIETVK